MVPHNETSWVLKAFIIILILSSFLTILSILGWELNNPLPYNGSIKRSNISKQLPSGSMKPVNGSIMILSPAQMSNVQAVIRHDIPALPLSEATCFPALSDKVYSSDDETELRVVSNSSECVISITFFGMRPFWRSLKKYSTLSNFPRNVLCPDVICVAQLTHTEIPREIQNSNIVIFSNVFSWIKEDQWKELFLYRSLNQRWLMTTQEGPLYTLGLEPPEQFANKTYDWTDTFRRDADFSTPYGSFILYDNDVKRKQPNRVVKGPPTKTKKYTNLVVWMASHCETLQWDRLQFVHDLQKIIPVDIYGKCGTKSLPWWTRDVMVKKLKKYKFFLSLENSCCTDYITEKFWKALDYELVPIVVGASLSDYEKVAPPRSFIHIDHYNSLTSLSNHLKHLATNENKYMEYFKWKERGFVRVNEIVEHIFHPLYNSTICNIVEKFKSDGEQEGNRTYLNYFGPSWKQSCVTCGNKPWITKYQYGDEHVRKFENIWSK